MTDGTMDKSSRLEAIIEIRLAKLPQLFNSLDPSPFHDRDLDHDAEEYIVGWAEEIALHLPLKLVIHLPQDQRGSADQPALERAVHNYFGYQQQQSRRRLRVFHDGRIALAVGIAFLFVCITDPTSRTFLRLGNSVGNQRRRHAHRRVGGNVAPTGHFSL